MARKVRSRTVTADDGTIVKFTMVKSDGVLTVDDDGNETFIPVSAQALRNTGVWFTS